ncbi:DeoR family transcriptional regulator, partial [Candidatus Amarolinea dominans]|uniref:DeoR family transcriptional regulator n=1 Tax=Candidatus Amarolinea dominans TaxID=3140696 RepID=UPI0031370F85|nr:DeoR family transcriptional regulator [Anaerolineae bacterium]
GDQILDLVPRAGVTNLRALGLNERQIEALRLMVNEGIEFTNQNYREHFGVVKKTVVRDLEKLIEHGLVRRVGRGRAIKYVAVGLMP